MTNFLEKMEDVSATVWGFYLMLVAWSFKLLVRGADWCIGRVATSVFNSIKGSSQEVLKIFVKEIIKDLIEDKDSALYKELHTIKGAQSQLSASYTETLQEIKILLEKKTTTP